VGLDCANGSTWMIAKSVFEALGAYTHVIGNKPTGLNINEDCGSTHINHLQNIVRENSLDVGFAFDGDADRCLAVDDQGNVVDGDKILFICGSHMSQRGELDDNTIVTTIMSNLGLYKALDNEGIRYVKTAVGDRFVYENMRDNGHLLGGEQSGHIIFSKYGNTGDGILTAIKIMQVMLDRKLPLSKLAQPILLYPQLLRNVRVTNKEAAVDDLDVQTAARSASDRLGCNGRLLIRKSGTEPLVRVMVEAPSAEICAAEADQIIKIMNTKGFII